MDRKLAEFQLIKSLGQGALGKAFLAEHSFMKKQFALKILPEDLAQDRAFITRFEQEISQLSSLDHPHLAKIHQVAFAEGCFYIVTDLAVGPEGEPVNLQQYLNVRKEELDEEETLSILTQVASALDYAHNRKRADGQGLAHLSLRPSNILLTGKFTQPRFVLTDFGLQRLIGPGRVLNYFMGGLSKEMTEEGGLSLEPGADAKAHDLRVGEFRRQRFYSAFQFLAPEQKKGEMSLGSACDVYAFGVLAYYLLVGEYPEGVFELPSLLRDDLELNWDRMIMSCLSANVARRPRSLMDLIEAVKSSAHAQEPTKTLPPVSALKSESGLKLVMSSASQAYHRALEGESPSLPGEDSNDALTAPKDVFQPAMGLEAASAAASFPAGVSALIPNSSLPTKALTAPSASKALEVRNQESSAASPIASSSEAKPASSHLVSSHSGPSHLGRPGLPGFGRGLEFPKKTEHTFNYPPQATLQDPSVDNGSAKEVGSANPSAGSASVIVKNNPALGTISQVYVASSTRPAPALDSGTETDPLLTPMKAVAGGRHLRGSNDGSRDEMPRHAVVVADFNIDIHPVTNEQFVRFLRHCGVEKDESNNDMIRLKESRIKRAGGKLLIEPGYQRHPVVGVTWYGALAYCKWVGKRLPTEAEWEIAARAGLEETLYPTGENIEKTQANFFNNDTTAVMSYPPNGYGLYDMAGNVYEWCQDWYAYNTYELTASEPMMPQGPLQGVYRVLRGGCWKSLKEDLRCAHRHRNNPGAVNRTYGFRCASSSPAASGKPNKS